MILSEVSRSFDNMGRSLMQQLATLIQPQLLNQAPPVQNETRQRPALVDVDMTQGETQVAQSPTLADAPISIPSDTESDLPS